MNTISRTLALVSWSVLMLGLSAPGCGQTLCEEQGVPLADNRDRKLFPNIDEDWVCITLHGVAIDFSKLPPPPPPPAPPDVSGDHPADNGPKDPDAVVNAAVVLKSCFGEVYFFWPHINWTIQSIYFEALRDRTTDALLRRSDCFKDKTNGCDAMRECVGLFQQVNGAPKKDIALDMPEGFTCTAGVVTEHFPFYDEWDVLHDEYTWFNCEGLGLACPEIPNGEWCATKSTPCDPSVLDFGCQDGRPYGCEFHDDNMHYYSFQQPLCSDYGLACYDDPNWGIGYPDCIGTGAACGSNDDWIYDRAVFSYAKGVACKSSTILRACVGNGEQEVDCTKFGKGFTCIDGATPHCGFAAECDDSTKVTCDGDSIVVCDAGRIRKIDCKSLGFTSCDAKHHVCSPGIYDNLP